MEEGRLEKSEKPLGDIGDEEIGKVHDGQEQTLETNEFADEWDEQRNEEENDEEENEEEEEEEEIKVAKNRCQRRKRLITVCWEEAEEEEVEEVQEQVPEFDDSCYVDISGGTSILSSLTFQWDDKIYEFEELCDPGTIENIYKRHSYVEEGDLIDEVGIRRYENLCKILRVPPIARFIKGLTEIEMDFSFRGIDSKNLKAMFAALETNTFVKKLVLRYNKLSKDDCYYLGRTLNVNETIAVLDLTACRIGPEGVGYLVEYLTVNETLVDLNLSRCKIEDEGVIPLAQVLLRNNSIEKLDLSYNDLKEDAADALAVAIKVNQSISDLNLCYNKFFNPTAMKEFFRAMTTNNKIKRLNLAWNAMSGPDVGVFIANFLRKNRSVEFLDLSDNRLEGLAIAELKNGIPRSRLKILKLGKNPMSPEDMDILLLAVKNNQSLEILDLDDLWAKKSFIKILKKIQTERELEVNIGGVYGDYEIVGADFAAILLKRANFEAAKPKSEKMKKDFGHLIWTLGEEALTEDEFKAKVKKFKAKVGGEVIRQLMNAFTIPKVKLIDVVAMKKKYLKLFPGSTPPPLPPPPPVIIDEGEGEEELEIRDFMTAVTAYADGEEQETREEGIIENEQDFRNDETAAKVEIHQEKTEDNAEA